MGGEEAFSRRFVVLTLAPFSSPRNFTAFLSEKDHGPKTTVINVYPLPVRVFLGIMKQIIQIKRNRVKKSNYWVGYLQVWPEI